MLKCYFYNPSVTLTRATSRSYLLLHYTREAIGDNRFVRALPFRQIKLTAKSKFEFSIFNSLFSRACDVNFIGTYVKSRGDERNYRLSDGRIASSRANYTDTDDLRVLIADKNCFFA